MNPLIITMVFLTLIAALFVSSVKHFNASHIESRLYTNYLAMQEKKAAEKAENCIQDIRSLEPIPKGPSKPHPQKPSESSPRKSRTLNFDLARVPNASRLNFHLLLDPKESQFHEMAASLLRELYSEFAFFNNEMNLEYKILQEISAQKEKAKKFTFSDELASLEFQDKTVQRAFYLMLKGDSEIPCLLDFITFDNPKFKKIKLMFAREELLHAVIKDKKLVKILLKERGELLEEILDQEERRSQIWENDGLNRTKISEKLKTLFHHVLSESGLDPKSYDKIFEYDLGKMGNILYVTDEKTGLVTREKLVSKS